MPRRIEYEPEQVALIREGYAAGRAVREIARQTGLARGTIVSFARRNGLVHASRPGADANGHLPSAARAPLKVPKGKTLRTCLSCGQPFASSGPGNRICKEKTCQARQRKGHESDFDFVW